MLNKKLIKIKKHYIRITSPGSEPWRLIKLLKDSFTAAGVDAWILFLIIAIKKIIIMRA
jgi:hypothetical protein